jgi:hypothetical protein
MHLLTAGEVKVADRMGWSRLKNGMLLTDSVPSAKATPVT